MQKNHRKYTSVRLVGVMLTAFVLSACHFIPAHLSRDENPHKMWGNPPLELTLAPTQTPTEVAAAETEVTVAPTETPTDLPTAIATDVPTATAAAEEITATATATAVPQPTITPRTAAAQPTATPTAQATPVVVIPDGFTKQVDSERGYSLALPRGYTLLDLRSAQFRNMANTLGMGAQLSTLTDFLDSPAGEMVGMLAAADLPGMIFGGLPTILQVLVLEASGATQDTAQTAIVTVLSAEGGFLSNATIETIENATINNLPGVRATASGNLAGTNRPMAGKVVGLLANQKLYVLVQLTETSKLTNKGPIFDQIIGTFRPE